MLGNSSDLTSAAGEGTAGLIPRICVELFQRFGLASGGGSAEAAAADTFSRGNGRASIQVSFCEVRPVAGRMMCVSAAVVREFPELSFILCFNTTLAPGETSSKRQASRCWCCQKQNNGVEHAELPDVP